MFPDPVWVCTEFPSELPFGFLNPQTNMQING